MRGFAKSRRRREAILIALIEQPTITAAAAKVGIAESTMFRLLAQSDFQSEFRGLRRQVVQRAIARIQAGVEKAAATLECIMTDPNASPSSRVAAARTIIETSLRAAEIEDIESRVAALEAASKGAN